MSVFLLVDRETELIDSYRPQTDNTSRTVTQADTVNENLQHVTPVDAPTMPSPSVGGEQGSRIRNGFSTGLRGLVARTQPFSGAVAKPPAIENAVIGEVGRNNSAGKLYAGVMNQSVQYTGAMSSPALEYVTG